MRERTQQRRPESLIDRIPPLGESGNCGQQPPDKHTNIQNNHHVEIRRHSPLDHLADSGGDGHWTSHDYCMYMSSRVGRAGGHDHVPRGGLVSLIPVLLEAKSQTKSAARAPSSAPHIPRNYSRPLQRRGENYTNAHVLSDGFDNPLRGLTHTISQPTARELHRQDALACSSHGKKDYPEPEPEPDRRSARLMRMSAYNAPQSRPQQVTAPPPPRPESEQPFIAPLPPYLSIFPARDNAPPSYEASVQQ
ncbi:uncharacterized protein B0I36DRAFT_331072 [Microdochium trichocladiopsis]|uniref:Uncharacterized protein n=1 Tax=Microdochium trichocladiopsis TaxID=1682393 RepID=A0A9P8Y331_9PEZI|nr:uncharacterized protein B0I36DRAFT_331072 [Microdochium trichocladiopsis]KAH7026639.1 hypothetical protein B0I36DRAFT_331072 [Microdochium trichocladiopsis]